jgi:biofilm PGA synthesis N-glycosyltransferase PgaC
LAIIVIMGLSTLLLTAFIAYLNLILVLGRGLKRLSNTSQSGLDASDSIFEGFIVLITHYNDSEKIPALLQSLSRQNYTGYFKVYVVDDHSAAAHLQALKIGLKGSSLETHLMQNELIPGKKNALEYAISRLKENFIVQLDADVVLEADFLSVLISTKVNTKADILLGLVKMKAANSFISRFAAFEFLSLQMSGMALAALERPIMANGAAMAYHAATWLRFKEVGREWDSGDDSFLVQAARRAKDVKIVAVLEATVSTNAPLTFKSFINQRVRWGAKSVAYPSFFAKSVALSVAFLNISLVGGILWALVFSWSNVWLVFLFFFLKAVVDYPLLRNFARMSNQTNLLKGYAVAAVFYPFYISLSLCLMVIPSQKKWKGREYR